MRNLKLVIVESVKDIFTFCAWVLAVYGSRGLRKDEN